MQFMGQRHALLYLLVLWFNPSEHHSQRYDTANNCPAGATGPAHTYWKTGCHFYHFFGIAKTELLVNRFNDRF
jgi:hypothetical protein